MKNKKPIYRIENKNKGGPYRQKYVVHWRVRSHSGSNHPNINLDFTPSQARRFFREEWKCGFKSKKQLTNWFTKKELKELIKLKFRIVEILPKKMVKGSKQVIFKGRTKTTEISLKELFN